jgi:hypothetical protein
MLFASKTNYFQLTDPKTEAFTFQKLLHHKKDLLGDQTELLTSAKQIVVSFITILKGMVENIFDIPIEKEFQVKRR